MHNPTFCNFLPAGPGLYTFSDMHVPPRQYTITCKQVKSFVMYDALLHSGKDSSQHSIPLGYEEFAFTFNFNKPDILVKFTTAATDGSIKVNGPTVTASFLVGNDEEPAAMLIPDQPVQPVAETPCDPDGGCWLDKCKAELIDDPLWDNLECSHHQNSCRDEAIKAHKDKRRRFKGPAPPAVPAPNIPHPPTNTRDTGAGSSSRAVALPTVRDVDVHMEGMKGTNNREGVEGPTIAEKKGKGRKK
ncbi:uncharacterized protein HD556DRAFT_1305032 [Suillus plorans]|uniref:Uncharacterized protein n=1 Tax=Suillus plorans TaxID=116603 RepID=A0A9P7J315_9AGAM|nr:uncharacterized protein HD556DRAFT_1305032 [Suillus plorans]KAG1800244.1 hypothetical protein HD556DRAFT_1305032 [Suillus plorans]